MEGQSVSINVEDLPWTKCECGGYTFRSSLMLKRVSKFESPTGKAGDIPVEVMFCESCNKIPSFVSEKIKGIPSELLANKSIILDGE